MNKIFYLADLAARAMFNDPLNAYFIQDVYKRRILLAEIYKVIIKYGYRFGRIYMPSASMEGVAVCKMPEDKELSGIIAAFCGGILLPVKVDIQTLKRLICYQSYADKINRQYVPYPHLHLKLLAVNPSLQGKGYGGRLLRNILAESGKRKVPCYLETQNGENVPLYQHFGFKIVYQGKITGTNIMHWAMIHLPV